MGGKWPFFSLENICEPNSTITYGVVKPGPEDPDGVAFIRGGDISNGKILVDQLRTITREVSKQYKRTLLSGGEILVSLVGNPGQVAIVPDRLKGANIARQVGLVRLKKGLSRRFVKYYLLSPLGQRALHGYSLGSVQQVINLKDLKRVEIPLPPLYEQKSIAHILGTLDDKIELNRQMNATLESMAQALFKSWFVDFDPVIDNALAAGNPIPDALRPKAELRMLNAEKNNSSFSTQHSSFFPDRFVFSEEMGWIPEGWGESSVGEQVETTGGGTPSTKEPIYWENGTHAFCTPKDMSLLSSMVLMDTERHLTDAGVNKISSGQLPPGTVLMSSRAPIGYLAISDIPVSVNQGIIGMLPSDKYGSIFLLCWAHFNIGKIEDRANGSTFLEISKKNFRPIPFVVPGDGLLDAFNDQAQAIYDKLLLTAECTESLTRLRDTLLPKLLSGELRIPDAEKILEQAL
jgi:type I restriction enzyme S subunit